MLLVELLVELAKRWKLIGSVTLVSVVIGVVLAFILPSWYRATAKIMPPERAQSPAALLAGQLDSMIGLANGTRKDSSELYSAALDADPVVGALVDQFDLKKVYRKKLHSDACKTLRQHTEISVTKEGIIDVTVEDRSADRAAGLANAYVGELRQMTKSFAFSEASQRRAYYEDQLKQTKEELVAAEVGLKNTQQSTGLLQPEAQAKTIIDSVVALRTQILDREAKLAALRSYATENNPDRVRLQQEIGALRAQLDRMTKDQGSRSPSDVMIPVGQVPEAGLEYVRRLRDLKYQEAMYEFLSKQIEAARIDEGKNPVSVQVLQQAEPPERRAWPKRSLIVVLSGAAGLLGACFWVVLLKQYADFWGALARSLWQEIRADS
jgi:tyrosine-protein kinase Etk/Wzc